MHTGILLALVTYALGFLACNESVTNPPENSGGSIKTGEEISVASQSISQSGGIVTVSAPGKPVDGLQIIVPANSFTESRTVSVSYAPVTSHSFGDYFKPVSPLITISNGGGYADSTMLVKIPVTLATGEIPIAFFFNDKTGKLEPIPVASFDVSSVTIMTKHFDVSGIAAGLAGSKHAQPSTLSNYAKLIVSGLSEAMFADLTSKVTDINTGYEPGIDDWEFVNNGSYLPDARAGHCAGQNASSIWYFFEKKKQTAKQLYGQFDQVHVAPDKIWEDNPLGYHMASALQTKLDWTSYSLKLYEEYVGMQDDWTWRALVVSMLLCKEPFAIGVYGMHNGARAGHDLTAYRIDIPAGKIYIADPNFPGNKTREILYANKRFGNYLSGLTAAQSDITFTDIKFNAKTAVVDWNVIGQTWNDVMVNKQNPGYPAYSLRVNDGAGYPLTDGLKTDLDTLDFNATWSQAGSIEMTVYDASGNRISPVPGQQYPLVSRDTIVLKPGENKLGIAVFGSAGGFMYYIDFQWITVTYQASSLRIDPATMKGSKDSDYVWHAVFESKPSRARYEWDFGDGSAKYILTNDTNGYHRYSAAGTYTIKLEVYDPSTSVKLGDATATATIGAGFEITSVVPDKVSYAMPVTINGSGFGATQGTSSVLLAGMAPESIISWSDTKIVATIPDVTSGSMTAQVIVGGQASNTKYLTRMYPKITSLSKSHAKPDELVEIRGQYFGYKQGTATLYHRYESLGWTIVTWSDTVVTALAADATTDWHYGFGNLYLARTGWGMSTIEFTLDEDVLRTLHRLNSWTTFSFAGWQLMYTSYPTPHEAYQGLWMNIYNKDFNHTKQLVWSGTAFTFTFTQTSGGGTYNITLDGTVSDDGTMIKTIHGLYEFNYQDQSTTQDHHYEYRFTDIPLKESYPSGPWVEFDLTGSTVRDHIVSVVYSESTNSVLQVEYRGTDWTSTQLIPEIKLRFEKQ
ncbi:MAG: IPT/TIG domain-containing protein [Bacteroidetes bacterium]|nr:IPT/TIG domain-containing protein [Bacteroidota bacterium]